MAASERGCCVPRCGKTRKDDTVLHSFPNPEKDKDRYLAWIQAVGNSVSSLDPKYVYKNRRVCHAHFKMKDLTWTKRLSPGAVPSLFLPDSTKKLIIDHDGGAGDAFAITLSLLNEKYFNGPKLVALTTTFGNVDLNQTIINSDRILALVDRQDIPIYAGAHQALISKTHSDHYYGLDGLGDDGYKPSGPITVQDTPAAVALLELSKKYEGELIIVAIGPVTNIALAVRMDPQFIDRLAHLYVGAGHIHSDTHPEPEFNTKMDPEAYHIVADSAVLDKVTFVAFSQTHLTLNASLDWRKNVLGKIDTPLMQALNGFERIPFLKKESWKDLDPAAASIAINNDIVDEFKNTSNGIILEGDKRGIKTNDFSSTNPNGRVVYIGNRENYKKLLLDLYSAELKS